MPWIIDCLVASEAAGMLADKAPILAQLDPVGIGADLDRPVEAAVVANGA
jgi:hypothetical protein